jgi:hypothetical protein
MSGSEYINTGTDPTKRIHKSAKRQKSERTTESSSVVGKNYFRKRWQGGRGSFEEGYKAKKVAEGGSWRGEGIKAGN